jgi:putative ABC transport system permease protein
VIAGFTVANAIGLFFGLWPALKASRLDPIAALRHE